MPMLNWLLLFISIYFSPSVYISFVHISTNSFLVKVALKIAIWYDPQDNSRVYEIVQISEIDGTIDG